MQLSTPKNTSSSSFICSNPTSRDKKLMNWCHRSIKTSDLKPKSTKLGVSFKTGRNIIDSSNNWPKASGKDLTEGRPVIHEFIETLYKGCHIINCSTSLPLEIKRPQTVMPSLQRRKSDKNAWFLPLSEFQSKNVICIWSGKISNKKLRVLHHP